MKRITTALFALAALTLALPASAASLGDIIRSTTSDPYMLNGQTTRMVFPDATTVQTWGSPVAAEVESPLLSQWKLAGAMPIREGSRLVKFGTDPQVYAVGPGGDLHWISSESVASALYGKDWNRKVVSLFPSFFPIYKVSTSIDRAEYPDGTLFKYKGSGTVYYLAGGVARPFINERAFKDNRFSFDSVLAIPDTFTYVKGNWIVGRENGLNPLLGAS